MSRKALSTIGSVVAVVAVLAVMLWGRSNDDPAAQQPRDTPASGTSASPSASTSTDVDPASGLPWVDVADLPSQAQETLRLIDAGGPFPYPGKDGSTFGNLEGLLPKQPRGYYAEYTVPTPGSRDRGARRIITGDGGDFYWTADHYSHFERVRR